jgi:hypothetical protein
MTNQATRPYTSEDVLYARRCRGVENIDTLCNSNPRLFDNPLYCGPIGRVDEYKIAIEYVCKAGMWRVPKVDEKEWSRHLSVSTMHITARRMCNLILGESDLVSVCDGSGREWSFTAEHDRGPSWSTSADIAAQVGRVILSSSLDSPKCVMTFSRGATNEQSRGPVADGFSVIVGAETWLDAHARLFHKCVEEARRRKLAAEAADRRQVAFKAARGAVR